MSDAYDHVRYLYFSMLPLFKQCKKECKHLRKDLDYEDNLRKDETTMKFHGDEGYCR